MLPEKKESKKEVKRGVDTDRMKILTASQGLQAETNLYSRPNKNSKNKKLIKEIKELSPEMKTVLFGKVLDKKED